MVVLRKQKENTTTAVGTTLNQSFSLFCQSTVFRSQLFNISNLI